MKELPFVSLIMPVRNEGRFIDMSVGAVLKQDYPQDRMEILIADGMSTDGTREKIEAIQAQNPRVRVVNNPGKIVSTGLNAALRIARGDVIVRVDGHCEIAPDFVSQCVEHLINDRVEGVGGPIETIGETYCAEAIAVAMSSKFGVGSSPFRTIRNRTTFVDTIAFPGYTRRAIEKAGFFDDELVRNQDDEYNYRLRKFGARLLLSPDIKSRYFSRSSLSSLARQYLQYGYWKVRVMQKHPLQMHWRQFVPSIFVGALLFLLIVAPFFAPARWALGAVLVAYLIANLGASFLTVAKSNWSVLPLLPVCFATLHISYGLGFIAGVIKFWNRWSLSREVLGTR